MRTNAAIGMLLAFVLAMTPGSAPARPQNARAVAKSVTPSVVLLVMQDDKGQPLSLGSGFVVADGVVATNLHVVAGARGATRNGPIKKTSCDTRHSGRR